MLAPVQKGGCFGASVYGWVMHAWRRQGIARALVEKAAAVANAPLADLAWDYSDF